MSCSLYVDNTSSLIHSSTQQSGVNHPCDFDVFNSFAVINLSKLWMECGISPDARVFFYCKHTWVANLSILFVPWMYFFLYPPWAAIVSLHLANQFLVRRSSSWWLEVKLPFNVCLQIWICVSLWVRSRDSTGDKTPTGDFFSFAWKSYGKWSTSAWNHRCCILIRPSHTHSI